MHIALVTYDDLPPIGGQGIYAAGLRQALEQKGLRVTTIAGHGDAAISYPRRTGRAPLDFSWHLARHPEIVTGSDPDIIHAVGGPGGVLLTAPGGRPVVYTATHTYAQAHSRRSPKRLLAPMEIRAYRKADWITPISATTEASLRRQGVPASRMTVIQPGYTERPSSGVPREPLLLFVGRLEPEKGAWDALDVMLALAPSARGTLVGSGSLLDSIRARIAAASADIAVPGRVSEEELGQWYARATVFLMPSQYEGLGLVALEAMSARTSVVAYDVPGIRDLAPSGIVLTPKNDVAAMTAQAMRLISEPESEDVLAARAAWCAERYSWSAAADAYIAGYRRLMERADGGE